MPPLIDEKVATRMLKRGVRVRDIAHHFGVSTQAVYLAIHAGRIKRPTKEQAEPATEGQA